MTSLLSIPPEITSLIVSHLQTDSDLARVGVLSPSFLHSSRRILCSEPLIITDPLKLIQLISFLGSRAGEECWKYIYSMTIDIKWFDCKKNTTHRSLSEAASLLLRNFNLAKLPNLRECTIEWQQIESEVLAQMTNLRKLTFSLENMESYYEVLPRTLELLSLPYLTTLSLEFSSSDSIFDKLLSPITLPLLDTLHLYGDFETDDLIPALSSVAPQLIHLHYGQYWGDEFLSQIYPLFINLESLIIRSPDHGIRFGDLRQVTKLTDLLIDLSYSGFDTEEQALAQEDELLEELSSEKEWFAGLSTTLTDLESSDRVEMVCEELETVTYERWINYGTWLKEVKDRKLKEKGELKRVSKF